MNKMKVLVILLMLFSTTSFAAEGKFEEKKQNLVESIDKRITILQTFKSCIQASQTKEAAKACRKTKKESMKALKESRKK